MGQGRLQPRTKSQVADLPLRDVKTAKTDDFQVAVAIRTSPELTGGYPGPCLPFSDRKEFIHVILGGCCETQAKLFDQEFGNLVVDELWRFRTKFDVFDA